MNATLRYVGLDVHKDSIVMAVAEGSGGDAVVWGRMELSHFTLSR